MPAGQKFRNQFSIFFLFVLISAIVWVFIKLSRDFSSTIKYRVTYQNLPAGKILVNASDSIVMLGLDAKGFDLVKYHLRKNKAVIDIDLSGIRLKPDGNSYKGYILTSGISPKIADQLGFQKELVFIAPDTLWFEFMPEYKRLLPVIAQVQYQLRPQHMLYDPVRIKPDSVWVFGPKSIVDTMQWVYSDTLILNDLQEDYHAVLQLQKPAGLPVTYSPDVTEIVFRVEKFTEKSIELPINVDCRENGLALRIFPEKATIHCFVALKDYKLIDEAMFELAVVYKPGALQHGSKLKVEVRAHPSWVRIARVEPERVEYLLVRPSQ